MNLLDLLIALDDCGVKMITKVYDDTNHCWRLLFHGTSKMPDKMPRKVARGLRGNEELMLSMVFRERGASLESK